MSADEGASGGGGGGKKRADQHDKGEGEEERDKIERQGDR